MARIIENPEVLILTTARELILSEGLSAFNMRKLAVKCDIALGTIYNYYPTKMDLLNSIIEDFWQTCFKNFYKSVPPDQDFFMTLERLYFYLLDYLDHFKTNWLQELSQLPLPSKQKGKAKESEFMIYFTNIFTKLLISHHQEFNSISYSEIDCAKLSKFILNNFLVMLKAHDTDYYFFESLLRKILL